jgi:hypothetical protein
LLCMQAGCWDGHKYLQVGQDWRQLLDNHWDLCENVKIEPRISTYLFSVCESILSLKLLAAEIFCHPAPVLCAKRTATVVAAAAAVASCHNSRGSDGYGCGCALTAI